MVIPPLRDRDDDVLLLARHFAGQIGKELRGREANLSEASVKAIRHYRWPGNVRELENAIERACILTDTMTLEPKDLGLGATADGDAPTLQHLDLQERFQMFLNEPFGWLRRKRFSAHWMRTTVAKAKQLKIWVSATRRF